MLKTFLVDGGEKKEADDDQRHEKNTDLAAKNKRNRNK